jgi:hypothetical protein
MDGSTLRRLHALLADIDDGTSPLTKQDLIEALRAALDAPSVAPDPWAVILATLETRLTSTGLVQRKGGRYGTQR